MCWISVTFGNLVISCLKWPKIVFMALSLIFYTCMLPNFDILFLPMENCYKGVCLKGTIPIQNTIL